ncbi:MAG TPA: DUF2147 domain-containing protein [Lysobacter sp.]|jgi:uncharacterized protein (DUF2147 family)|nr:DUF2147 domain-containing protein [Lysobacter sp.]
MRTKLFALLLALPLLASSAAFAQTATSPLGRWKTFDDETGKPMSITEVYEAKNGKLAAKVVETLNTPNAMCTKCSGDKKNKPVIGMPVLWNLEKTADGWGNGQGFKPSTGDSFKAKSVKLIDGGNKLEITGCKLALFCRTAHWARVD